MAIEIVDLPSKDGDFPIKNGDLPIKIVDFPINSMVIFHCKLLVHQRVFNFSNPHDTGSPRRHYAVLEFPLKTIG